MLLFGLFMKQSPNLGGGKNCSYVSSGSHVRGRFEGFNMDYSIGLVEKCLRFMCEDFVEDVKFVSQKRIENTVAQSVVRTFCSF